MAKPQRPLTKDEVAEYMEAMYSDDRVAEDCDWEKLYALTE